MNRAIYYPDTNFFLQYRDAPELPWREITDASEIALLVCRGVQGEIDDLKGNGNARRAGRARKVSAQFRTVVLSGNPLVLRESNPRLVLDFAPRPADESALDSPSTKTDDRIIAEALAAAALVDAAAALLTDDTGMMLSARDRGLAFVPTPDMWRLPAEKDERDRQIGELRAEIARLSQSAPQLTVEVSSKGQALTEPLLVHRIEYPPLSPEIVEELTLALEAHYPMRTDFSREADPNIASAEALRIATRGTAAGLAAHYMLSRPGVMDWKPPSDSSIKDYRDAYAKWLSGVRRFLEELHTALPGRSGRAPLQFSLHNSGSVPADQVLVDIETLGGLMLALRPKKEAKASLPPLALPAAPEAPGWEAVISGSWNSALRAVHGASLGANSFAHEALVPFVPPFYPLKGGNVRNEHTFYWRDGAPNRWVESWGFRCGEFRHQAEAETFSPLIVVPVEKSITRGAVRIRASARNLPQRIERTVAVRVSVETGDTGAAARSLMPKPPIKLGFKSRFTRPE